MDEFVSVAGYSVPVVHTFEAHRRSLAVYGVSVMCVRSVAPDVFPACTGIHGDGEDSSIPDTPLEEWNAKVDALLAECEARNSAKS